jgi:hypothetical protein
MSGATASFSGTGVTVNSTTFVSASQLTANITISSTAPTGARDVTVTNPDQGTGTCTGCFTVNGGPTVTSTNPASRGQGATNQTITVNGTGFANGANATFSGSGITVNSTTFVSATQLTANITISAGAPTGTARDVTVTNPDQGTGTCTGCFTVNAGPTITFPTSSSQKVVANGTSTTFTITGTNFVSGATVSISGGFTVNTLTFVDSSHLSVNVTANNGGGARGSYNLTVKNPDGGSATSVNSMVNQ